MPIQIIITGNDAGEAMSHMAQFIGMRGVQQTTEELRQASTGNGATAAVADVPEGPVKPPRRPGRPRKTEPEPEAEQQTDVDTAAQDDADEAQQEPADATADDVRAALNDVYVKRYGMEATQKDILQLYARAFPDGSVTKVSDIPEGQHGMVIAYIKEMAAKNPFKRKDLTK